MLFPPDPQLDPLIFPSSGSLLAHLYTLQCLRQEWVVVVSYSFGLLYCAQGYHLLHTYYGIVQRTIPCSYFSIISSPHPHLHLAFSSLAHFCSQIAEQLGNIFLPIRRLSNANFVSGLHNLLDFPLTLLHSSAGQLVFCYVILECKVPLVTYLPTSSYLKY